MNEGILIYKERCLCPQFYEKCGEVEKVALELGRKLGWSGSSPGAGRIEVAVAFFHFYGGKLPATVGASRISLKNLTLHPFYMTTYN